MFSGVYTSQSTLIQGGAFSNSGLKYNSANLAVLSTYRYLMF